jgi:hypothetical protein
MGDNVLFSFQVKQGFMLSELPYYLIWVSSAGWWDYTLQGQRSELKNSTKIKNKWIRMMAAV